MGKLFSWVVIGAIAYLAWRLLTVVQRKPVAGRAGPGQPGRPPEVRAREQILRCEVCGVHVPASEAVSRDGHHFCSVAHRDQD